LSFIGYLCLLILGSLSRRLLRLETHAADDKITELLTDTTHYSIKARCELTLLRFQRSWFPPPEEKPSTAPCGRQG